MSISELDRAEMGVREATDRADRLRKAGRADLADLAEGLVTARKAVVDALRKALDAEREAGAAEEAHAAALKNLDRATAAREERRQRLARLADQLAQAEKELEAPAVVSMPRKGSKGTPTHGTQAIDAPPPAKKSSSDAKAVKP